jgi:hypothetical protein
MMDTEEGIQSKVQLLQPTKQAAPVAKAIAATAAATTAAIKATSKLNPKPKTTTSAGKGPPSGTRSALATCQELLHQSTLEDVTKWAVPKECQGKSVNSKKCGGISDRLTGMRMGMRAEVFAHVVTAGNAKTKDSEPYALSDTAILASGVHRRWCSHKTNWDLLTKKVVFDERNKPKRECTITSKQAGALVGIAYADGDVEGRCNFNGCGNQRRDTFLAMWSTALRDSFPESSLTKTVSAPSEILTNSWRNCWYSQKADKMLERAYQGMDAVFIDGLEIQVMDPQNSVRFVQKGKSADGCKAQATWCMGICSGCSCKTGELANGIDFALDEDSASKCDDWFVALDNALRSYMAALRAVLLSNKVACCSRKVDLTASNLLCQSQKYPAPSSSAQQAPVVPSPQPLPGFQHVTGADITNKLKFKCTRFMVGASASYGNCVTKANWKQGTCTGLAPTGDQEGLDFKDAENFRKVLQGRISCIEKGYAHKARLAFAAVMGQRYFPPNVESSVVNGNTIKLSIGCGAGNKLDVFNAEKLPHRTWINGKLQKCNMEDMCSKPLHGGHHSRVNTEQKKKNNAVWCSIHKKWETCAVHNNQGNRAKSSSGANVEGMMASALMDGGTFETFHGDCGKPYIQYRPHPDRHMHPNNCPGGKAQNEEMGRQVRNCPTVSITASLPPRAVADRCRFPFNWPQHTSSCCPPKGFNFGQSDSDDKACFREWFGNEHVKGCSSEFFVNFQQCSSCNCKDSSGMLELLRVTNTHTLKTDNSPCKPWFTMVDASIRQLVANVRAELVKAKVAQCSKEENKESAMIQQLGSAVSLHQATEVTVGRRGGALKTNGNFEMSSGNRAGNSEEDEQDEQLQGKASAVRLGSAVSMDQADNLDAGRRGGALTTKGEFSIMSGNRAGNSEEDEQDQA